MSSIQEILASILKAVYGKDVRQAIHDGVEMAYNKADNAETSAAAAADAASGSQNSAAASAQAAANSASSASDFADAAEQYKNEAFHTTPAGYEAFVSNTNKSLNDLYNNGVKNLLKNEASSSSTSAATWVVNSDGTINCSVTSVPSGNNQFNINNSFKLPAGKYRLTGLPSGQTGFYIQMFGSTEYNTGVGIINRGFDSEKYVEWEFTSEQTCRIFIVVTSSSIVQNIVFKPMITLQGVPNSDYAHYVPYAQSNAALTENTKGKVIYTHDIGSSETIATALNSVYSELQGLSDSEYAKVTLQVKIYNGGINSYKLSTSIGSKMTFYSLMDSNSFRFVEITNSVSSCKFIANNNGTITDLSNLTDWANGQIRLVI